MAKGNREARRSVKVQSSESGHCSYVEKNRNNSQEKLELRKYDPTRRKHVVDKEGKI